MSTTEIARPREEHWLQTWAAKSLPSILPNHLTPERVARVALAEFARTPKLAECDKASLCLCIMTASQMGLEVSGPLGHAYLIPRWSGRKQAQECTLIIGYKGLALMALRSGDIATMDARLVYDGEDFEIVAGSTPSITHRPSLTVKRTDDKIVASYCVVVTKDGGTFWDFCARDEIEDRRKRGASGQTTKSGKPITTPWDTDYAAMARKCAVRKLLMGGMVPLSTDDLRRAVEHEIEEEIAYRHAQAAPAIEMRRPMAAILDAEHEREAVEVSDDREEPETTTAPTDGDDGGVP